MKSNVVQTQRRKMTIKNNVKNAVRSLLLYFVYYPIVLPIEKITKYVKDRRDTYWMNNEDKLRRGMLQEIAVYVASYIIREDNRNGFQTFLIYNSYENEDINYGNAFHLRSFIQFSFYTSHKNYKSKLYYENEKIKYGDKWSEDKFYDGLMKYLENEFRNLFKSETIKLDIESKWGKDYQYIIIKR